LTNAIADAKKPLSSAIVCHVISLLLLPYFLFLCPYGK